MSGVLAGELKQCGLARNSSGLPHVCKARAGNPEESGGPANRSGVHAVLECMLDLGPAQGVAVTMKSALLTARCSATHAGDDVIGDQCLHRKERHTAVGWKRLPCFLADGIRSPDGRPAIVPRLSSSQP